MKNNSIERDYWSEGGQIFFSSGWAWGVAPNLRRICLGKEEDILRALSGSISMGDTKVDDILRIELNCRGKENVPSRPRMRRTRMADKNDK